MIVVPPPPPAGQRPDALYDTECYPNYWLLKLRPRGGVTYSFPLFAGQSFTYEHVARMKQMFGAFRCISFNGKGYDKWMISAAMLGCDPAQLKVINDRIIVGREKPWEIGLPDWEPEDHIDVMEVAPGAGGLKQYAGRIHSRRIQDLPYSPDTPLTEQQIAEVDTYCENDNSVLEDLWLSLAPQIQQREALTERYGIDLRSKSDAQVAEAVLRKRCEQALGRRVYKPDVDWNLSFKYKVPAFISFGTPQLARALEIVRHAEFRLGASGAVEMPAQLEGLEIGIGVSVYKMGLGGLHSQEKKLIAVSSTTHQVRMPDVASYYPNLMLNSGEYPPALGPAFLIEFADIKEERLRNKALAKKLKAVGNTSSPEYVAAKVGDGGGKIMINGTFGKTGSPYSVLFAPQMLIQTTLTGQLSLLMLIEWHEHYGIPVISANTDGLVINCPRHLLATSEALIAEWQRRTGLEMETDDYVAIYARDVNNYFAIKTPDDVKRKGEYAKTSLIDKKNPDLEICSDAVADFLAKGTSIEGTVRGCRDLRKFITIQVVAGGGVKMWGEGPRKNTRIKDMEPALAAAGWLPVKRGLWQRGDVQASSRDAYVASFPPQTPEYLGKVVRWYYGTNSPGPIVYATNGNTVSLSYGAMPCMTLPDTFPEDIDYAWYLAKCDAILHDIGFYTLR